MVVGYRIFEDLEDTKVRVLSLIERGFIPKLNCKVIVDTLYYSVGVVLE